MFKIFFNLFILLTLSCFSNNDVKFKARSITLHLPNKIIASGNTSFKNNDISITSNDFNYDISTATGAFQDNVKINYKNASLSGNRFNINNQTKNIYGEGQIKFNSPTIQASSNKLNIKNYEVLTLHDNVHIQQNGSQINSDELIYNLMTDTIISNQRIKLKISE